MLHKSTVISHLRLFFMAHSLSSLGDFVGYVALIILANQRFHDPKALGVLILAEFLPSVFLGAVIGNFVDSHSKRLSAVTADLLRVGAFIGLAVSSSFAGMLFWALLAGFGGALYYASVQSGLPNMASGKRLSKVLAWQSTVTSVASIVGPLLGAALLTIWRPQLLLFANGLSFLVSASILAAMPLDKRRSKSIVEPPSHASPKLSLIGSLRQTAKLPPQFRVLLAALGFLTLFGGMIGVAEIYFALENLNLGQAGFGILIGAYGGGTVLGNLAVMHPRLITRPKQGFLLGVFLIAAGLIICSLLRQPILAIAAFTAAGFGNGMTGVSSRMLIVKIVKPARQGLAYGTRHGVESTGFVIALLSAAFLVSTLGARTTFFIAGTGAALTLAGSWFGFRQTTPAPQANQLKPAGA